MAEHHINLRPAEQQRLRLTRTQQKQIKRLYERAARAVAEQAKQAPRVPSDLLKKRYLKQLQAQLDNALTKIQTEMDTTIREGMHNAAAAVIEDNLAFLKKVGMPVGVALAHVPDEIVRTVATGQLYQGKWSLSGAIWKHIRKNQRDIQTIIAQGIAQNKSAFDIAKDLERYVDPSAKKALDWSKVYPHTSKQVDYNAQRLARTMVSHAYQQAFVQATQNNPFVTKYRWVADGGRRTCPICAARDGMEFAKDALPLDHPNGMCTFVAVLSDSMTDIADRIADWTQGGDDPALDNFADTLGGNYGFQRLHDRM